MLSCLTPGKTLRTGILCKYCDAYRKGGLCSRRKFDGAKLNCRGPLYGTFSLKGIVQNQKKKWLLPKAAPHLSMGCVRYCSLDPLT